MESCVGNRICGEVCFFNFGTVFFGHQLPLVICFHETLSYGSTMLFIILQILLNIHMDYILVDRHSLYSFADLVYPYNLS